MPTLRRQQHARSRRSRHRWPQRRWRSLQPKQVQMPEPQLLGSSLPLEPHEGLATVAVTSEWESAHLISDPLPQTIARVALPAVASSLLMTLFFSVDTFWIGTRLGASGLAAASTAVFWIWLIVSVAEMVNVGLTAVASRRHGERRPDLAARVAGDALVLSLVLGAACAV